MPGPVLNITLKEGGDVKEYEKARKEAVDKGGKIQHEFSLIKGFTVEMPEDQVNVLQSNDHVHVERDGEVKTQ